MLQHPGDLDLDDPSSLPLTERPPDLPPPMAMLPSNRPLPSNYHDDARKLLFCTLFSLATQFLGLAFLVLQFLPGSLRFLSVFFTPFKISTIGQHQNSP